VKLPPRRPFNRYHRNFRFGDPFPLLRVATCVCAIASPSVAADGGHDRGNSALGTGARSVQQSVPRSRRACQTHGPLVLAPKGREAAQVFREEVWGGLRLSDAGAVLPLHASDATVPIAERIVWTRLGSGRPLKWTRLAATEPWRQTGEPPTFLRRAAYIPMDVASLSTSRQERIFVYRIGSRTKMGVSGRSKVGPPGQHESRLEVESQFGRIGSRRDEVGSAERGEEIVKRNLVGQVDGSEAQAPPVVVFGEE
jgi:hypothetical protein